MFQQATVNILETKLSPSTSMAVIKENKVEICITYNIAIIKKLTGGLTAEQK